MPENANVLLLSLHGNTDYILILFNIMKKDGDNCFVYEIRFDGVNFPTSSPVIQKETVKWEPSTEKMYVRDGVLKGDVNTALLLEGGGHYRCDFKTTYKYVFLFYYAFKILPDDSQ